MDHAQTSPRQILVANYPALPGNQPGIWCAKEGSPNAAYFVCHLRSLQPCETRRLSLVGRPFEVVSAGRDGEAPRPTLFTETEEVQ